jgi:hypothetical protein
MLAGLLDYHLTFSNAEKTAKFVKDNGYESKLNIGYGDYAASAIAGYLNASIFYPEANRSGTFIIWDNRRRRLDTSSVLDAARRKSAILILNAPVPDQVQNNFPSRKIFESHDAVVLDENFFVYDLNDTPGSTPSIALPP